MELIKRPWEALLGIGKAEESGRKVGKRSLGKKLIN
jgi:hypothetical protein